MITTTLAATTPAPAYGPATAIAGGENASPAAAGQAAPYATHPNTTKETIPMTDQMIPAGAIRAWRKKFEGCTGNTGLEALDDLLASATEDTAPKETPMTDKPAHEVTDEDRRIARDWAEHIIKTPGSSIPMEAAAARVILHAVPTPPRPTLADMTLEERVACRWMQCDVRNATVTRGVLANNHGGNTHVLDAKGEVWYLPPTDITPRPDLPRLTWPGDQKPAPALPEGWRLADHKDYGRVIVTTTPDTNGHVYFVLPNADDPLGYDWHFCEHAELTYIDQEADQ